MAKIRKGIAALFLSVVGAGALVAERDTVFKHSVDHNFYAGA